MIQTLDLQVPLSENRLACYAALGKYPGSLYLDSFVKMSFPEWIADIADLGLHLQGGTNETPDQCSARAQKIEECFSLKLWVLMNS